MTGIWDPNRTQRKRCGMSSTSHDPLQRLSVSVVELIRMSSPTHHVLARCSDAERVSRWDALERGCREREL